MVEIAVSNIKHRASRFYLRFLVMDLSLAPCVPWATAQSDFKRVAAAECPKAYHGMSPDGRCI